MTRIQIAVMCAAVLAVSVQSAPAAVLPMTSEIGGFNANGFGGAFGFVLGTAVSGSAGRGNFGGDFGGPSLVDSITLDQFSDASRHRPNAVEFFNELGQSWTVNFVDTQAVQTVSFSAVNGGQPIPATYLIGLVRSQHTTGSGDINFGIDAYNFDGTFLGPAESNNANFGLLPVTTGSLGGFNNPIRATDGTLDNNSGTAHGTFFVRNAGTDTITVNYGSPQTIGSIGLGFDTGGANRDIPKFVTLSYTGGSQNVVLDDDFLQYDRYELSSVILDTNFLTITFPDGSVAADWYLGGDANYGLTEFEAFTTVIPAPEPGTLGLFAVGLVMMRVVSRRRR